MEKKPSFPRRLFLNLPFIGVLLGGSAAVAEGAAKKKGGAGKANLNKDIEELSRKLLDLAATLSRTSPPVGAVIAYLGQWPPKKANGVRMTEPQAWNDLGWALCKGQEFNAEQHPELFEVLGSKTLPNFYGKVARGCLVEKVNVGGPEAVGNTGGKDLIPGADTGLAGGHTHNLPPWTGLMGIIPNTVAFNAKQPTRPYSVKDDNGGWTDNAVGNKNAHHIQVGGGNQDEGQHAHHLGGTVEAVNNHTHTIPQMDIVPSYVAVNYIIKVKSL